MQVFIFCLLGGKITFLKDPDLLFRFLYKFVPSNYFAFQIKSQVHLRRKQRGKRLLKKVENKLSGSQKPLLYYTDFCVPWGGGEEEKKALNRYQEVYVRTTIPHNLGNEAGILN